MTCDPRGAYGWKTVATNVQEIAGKGLTVCDTIARISFGILAMHEGISTRTLAGYLQ